jgi:hypothetical protein
MRPWSGTIQGAHGSVGLLALSIVHSLQETTVYCCPEIPSKGREIKMLTCLALPERTEAGQWQGQVGPCICKARHFERLQCLCRTTERGETEGKSASRHILWPRDRFYLPVKESTSENYRRRPIKTGVVASPILISNQPQELAVC